MSQELDDKYITFCRICAYDENEDSEEYLVDKLKQCIDSSNVNYRRNKTDNYPINVAIVESRSLFILKYLLEQGADVTLKEFSIGVILNCLYSEFDTAYHDINYKVNIDKIKLLVKYGADINTVNHDDNTTPLMYAFRNFNQDYDYLHGLGREIYQYIKVLGAKNINELDHNYYSYSKLSFFCENGYFDKLEEEIKNQNIYELIIKYLDNDFDIKIYYNEYLLHSIFEREITDDKVKIFKHLLELVLNPNITNRKRYLLQEIADRYSSDFYFVNNYEKYKNKINLDNYKEVIKLFVKYGGDLNQWDKIKNILDPVRVKNFSLLLKEIDET